jgi:glycosyltransferase involved in cell wall biosynthesis
MGYIKRFLLLFTLARYDIVYTFLWVTPFGPPLFERLATLINSRIVYDIDDAIFLKSKSLINQYANWIKGRSKPFFMMRKAKQVIACTPYLTNVALQYNKNVTDISSTIDTIRYQPVNSYQNKELLTLGWSGSHSTSQYLQLLQPVLAQLQQTHPFKLLVMGDPHFKMEGVNVEAIAWSDAVEIPTLQRFDIGLYPLPLADDWVLGKSGLKALQYMAVGVPVVATAIGANFRIITHQQTGLLVQTNEEWLNALIQLLEDATLRKKIGLAGRTNVEKFYSINANAEIYLAILLAASK